MSDWPCAVCAGAVEDRPHGEHQLERPGDRGDRRRDATTRRATAPGALDVVEVQLGDQGQVEAPLLAVLRQSPDVVHVDVIPSSSTLRSQPPNTGIQYPKRIAILAFKLEVRKGLALLAPIRRQLIPIPCQTSENAAEGRIAGGAEGTRTLE